MSRKRNLSWERWESEPHFTDIENERNPPYWLVQAERDPKMSSLERYYEQLPNHYREEELAYVEWLQRITYKD